MPRPQHDDPPGVAWAMLAGLIVLGLAYLVYVVCQAAS
jgi:hypothetical protein